ncbi:MAG TPA: hypothetical protein VGG75_41110 [Trebonia sp.]|jgi:hypothetical protein
MRLRIDTNEIKFRVAGTAKPRMESRQNQRQKKTPDGRPIWTVRLIAIDSGAGSTETIWVEVAGAEPALILDEIATVQGLVFAPWVSKKNEIMRSFRAESVTQDSGAKSRAA